MRRRSGSGKRRQGQQRRDAVKGEGRKQEKPLEEYQYNFMDPESRIMKVGNEKPFEQSYNAQGAVDTETMLVVGG
jgi:hypothetical protein